MVRLLGGAMAAAAALLVLPVGGLRLNEVDDLLMNSAETEGAEEAPQGMEAPQARPSAEWSRQEDHWELVINREDMEDVHVDRFSARITNVSGNAKSRYNVPVDWYVVSVFDPIYGRKQFSEDRWLRAMSKSEDNGVQVGVVGLEIVPTINKLQELQDEAGSCEDQENWMDRDSKTCDDYKKEEWCTRQGWETKNWKGLHAGLSMWFYRKKGEDGTKMPAAMDACCACGGGKIGSNGFF